MKKIKKILIANRGEIAVRVIKTCKLLGIESHSIYATDDKDLLHVSEADFSHCLGEGELKETYLNGQKIIEIAKSRGIDGIHPGYGFLSENPIFSEQVKSAGIIFIGPDADSMKVMGDKIQSKIKADELGVPLIPGYHGDNQDPNFLLEEAKKIGFPVLIKASAGGGGKGMRVVRSAEDFLAGLESCQRESLKSFGNDAVLVEKFIEKPRHIEVQVFGDGNGGAVHLFERECSLQRRHQKVVEEAPSFVLDEQKRNEICGSAVKLAAGMNYSGAGTVEFIYTPQGEFYFLEMNTRLQVEHPVTEEITGFDLVKWQIEVAESGKLPKVQAEIRHRGFALECRIYAEDPDSGFLPSSGVLQFIGDGDGVRVDTGFRNGNFVGINYDPMIAKVISYAEDREQARMKMLEGLKSLPFFGLKTNRDFLVSLLETERFVKVDYHTNSIEEGDFELIKEADSESLIGVFHLLDGQGSSTRKKAHSHVEQEGPWEQLSGFYS